MLKAVINKWAAKRVGDIEGNLMGVHELIEGLDREALTEDFRVTVISDLCLEDLKEHVEMIQKSCSTFAR